MCNSTKALSSQTVFFYDFYKKTAFQLFLGCKNHLGSVKPDCMATIMLRRSDRPKQPKNSIFAVNLQFLRG